MNMQIRTEGADLTDELQPKREEIGCGAGPSVSSSSETLAECHRTNHLLRMDVRVHANNPMNNSLKTLLVALLITITACRNPQADAQVAEQLRQLSDELNGARQDQAAVHDQVDSLRIIVARQDTLLRQLAGMAGVPVPR